MTNMKGEERPLAAGHDHDEEAGEHEIPMQVMDHVVDDQLIRERNQGIKQIERDLEELHGCFVDLSVMVDAQQDSLDQIESNVSQADATLERGLEELSNASELQKKARKKMCCIIAIILVVILIILLATGVFWN
eukprot:TRINITY_DN1166_c0_g1::TRINITY_DN1166_c0_g1_i1::g.17279::m.17279 TRINITY_DN1166_c0_g1::TRINITY_DN1166_c0_g1_i1::g.17279  ORF type:complete len:134 (+),score=26.76,sp/O64791/SY124_ARATH/37.76/8e-16,SNARE/PF05739.14/1.3e-14,DUF3040/PF11239.3/1.2e+03,DUF3040/PF11239.3/0.00077,Fusion_gly/PF00523.13/0.0019,Tropomyosin_1/PF12718.2/0.0092,CHASE3/PF05227.8/0.028,ETRAMP/PF09716.5/4.2e+03,ETRAMP/PF09716.5/0.025,DUF1510/PF07423.6/0.065,Herpes_US9/PF06072.6/0.097,MMPL/PF03176.10/0.18,DUF3753/PF12575.3/3.9e+0